MGVESPSGSPSGLPFTESERIGLMERLERIEDPRGARGRRHGLGPLLGGIVVALLCRARTVVEITEVLKDLGRTRRGLLGLTYRRSPSRSTIRRVLGLIDPGRLADALCGWAVDTVEATTRLAGLCQDQRPRTVAGHRRVRHLAVDGKTIRGARRGGAGSKRRTRRRSKKKTTTGARRAQTRRKAGTAVGRAPHVYSVMDVATRIVLAQIPVGEKTNEIGEFTHLMGMITDLEGALVTADAMGAQDKHATWLHERGAGLLVRTKDNRPALLTAIQALPFEKVPPVMDQTEQARHGRTTRRVVRVIDETTHLPFPHAAQAVQVTTYTRTTDTTGRRRWKISDVSYAICTIDPARATAAELAQIIREHWRIEIQHFSRDVTMREDACLTRTANTTVNLAALPTTALNILAAAGITTIAQALRHHQRRPKRAIKLLTSINAL